ncbi:DHX37 [Symbiodinium sp. CCMP2456]|nr:DHX37 [Symbiodinium sp. CCMP2456]
MAAAAMPAAEAVQSLAAQLPCGLDEAAASQRRELFVSFDPNGNAILSLAEVDDGLKKLLPCPLPREVVARAFHAAKAISAPVAAFSNDYIDEKEFHYFVQYLHHYLQLWSWFCEVDTSCDQRVSIEEFRAALPQLNERLPGDLSDAAEAFNEVDADGGGMVLFDEFAHWVLCRGLALQGPGDEGLERQHATELLRQRPNLASADGERRGASRGRSGRRPLQRPSAGPNLPREFRELRRQVGPAVLKGQGHAQLEQKLELRSTPTRSVPAISGKNLQRRRSHVEDILVRNLRRFSQVQNCVQADHIIGHACAIVGNLTCWESVQELDEGKTAMLENELVRAQREAQRRLDEATKKQAPKWSQLRDDAEGLLWLMGGYAWAARGGETAAESFCQQNKINPRQMAEAHSLMQQLAELLQRRLSLSETELELQLPLLPKPPSAQQALLLRECIVEGLLDRVAVACPDLGNRAYICADLGREHPVFIHTSSNAFRHRPHPSVLVFNEIISTHKHFMRDCVTVDPLQLAKRAAAGGCPLLQLGEFLPVPGPRYLSEQDKVLAFASPLYAPLSYSLPTVEVDVPSESNFRYKVFAKALLEGAVVRGLPSQDKLLARPSLLLHAPTNPRVSAMVSPLWQFRVGSRRQLITKWRSDRRFLLEGYLKWLPSSMHDDVRLAWPPLGKS